MFTPTRLALTALLALGACGTPRSAIIADFVELTTPEEQHAYMMEEASGYSTSRLLERLNPAHPNAQNTPDGYNDVVLTAIAITLEQRTASWDEATFLAKVQWADNVIAKYYLLDRARSFGNDWSTSDVKLAAKGFVRVGMPIKLARTSWNCSVVNVSVGSWGSHVQYRCEGGGYLYTKNSKRVSSYSH